MDFLTKIRHNESDDRHLTHMDEIMRAVCVDFETELVEFNGTTTTYTCS